MYYFDLDFGPMTLTLELDLEMVVTYLHAENYVNRSSGSKVIIRIHRQTDRNNEFRFFVFFSVLRMHPPSRG